MNFGRMTEIQEDLFRQIREIRKSKGLEYATELDTLADFKEVAAEAGVTPIQCWAVYVKKHLRAVDSFVRSGEVLSESIESRVLDVVTYHILLLGLIEDLDPRQPGEENATDAEEWRKPVLGDVPMADLGADAIESDGQRLTRLGVDGDRWARDFVSELASYVVGGYTSPHEVRELAHTWFANAIEAGRTAGQAQR